MLQYQQSETTAERRRWMIHLVDVTDGITALTGQTGQGKISKNGADAVDTTNSLVEVDAVDMPGFYYIELTQAELNTLGFIGLRVKTAGSAEFQDRAIVSYNDPYLMQGGFSGGGSTATITKKQLDYIVEQVSAEVKKIVDTVEVPATDLTPVLSKISEIVIPVTDLAPVIEKIEAIQIPTPKDYSATLQVLLTAIKSAEKVNTTELRSTIKDFMSKMAVATSDINASMETVAEIKDGFASLKTLVDEFGQKVSEMSDMDKRFEAMTSTMQRQQLTELTTQIDTMMKKILLSITNTKYDLLNTK